MDQKKFKTSYILTILIIALAALAASGGLAIPGAYRDNALVASGWYGNDVVTLLAAVPLLILSMALARRGSAGGLLLWIGMLDYTLYNYAFYLFGAAFNIFFLVYTALFTLSIFALLFSVPFIDVRWVVGQFSPRTPTRLVAGYSVLVGLLLGGIWCVWAGSFIFTGSPPAMIAATGHITAVVFALDLSMVVPWMLLAAFWLWHGRAWGYVLAVVMHVKGALYMLALSAATLSAKLSGAASGDELPIWAGLGAGSAIAVGLMLWGLRQKRAAV